MSNKDRMNTKDYNKIMFLYTAEHDVDTLHDLIMNAGGYTLLMKTFCEDIVKYKPVEPKFFTIRFMDQPTPTGVVKAGSLKQFMDSLSELFEKGHDYELAWAMVREKDWERLCRYDPLITECRYITEDGRDSLQIEIQKVHTYGDINK